MGGDKICCGAVCLETKTMAIFSGQINRLETQLRKLRLNGLWRGWRSSNGREVEVPSPDDFAIYEDSAGGGENQEASGRESTNRSTSPLQTASERDLTDIVPWDTGNIDGMTLHSGEENREPREEQQIQIGEAGEQEICDNETATCYYENTEHHDIRRFPCPRTTSQSSQTMQQRLCVMMAVEHSFTFGSGLPVSRSRLQQNGQASSRTTDPRKRNASWPKQKEHAKRQSLPVVDTSEANLTQQITSYSSSASRQTVNPDGHHKTIRPLSMFTGFASTAWTKSWHRIKMTFKTSSSDQQKQADDNEN